MSKFGRRYEKEVTEQKFNKIVAKQVKHFQKLEAKKQAKVTK